jgi:hypothetical protein
VRQGLLLVLPPIAQARALLTLELAIAGAALGQLPAEKRKAAVLSVTGRDRAQLVAALAPAELVELLETLSTDQAIEMVLGMAADCRALVLADPGVSAAKLGSFLQALSAEERCAILAALPPQRLARALGSLPPKERVAALSALPLAAAAGALSVTRPQDSAAALASLQPAAAQAVLSAMPSRERFLAIEKMKPQIAASLLAAMLLNERVVRPTLESSRGQPPGAWALQPRNAGVRSAAALAALDRVTSLMPGTVCASFLAGGARWRQPARCCDDPALPRAHRSGPRDSQRAPARGARRSAPGARRALSGVRCATAALQTVMTEHSVP